MCGNSFWKKIVSLCLTFWFGVLATNLIAPGNVVRTERPAADKLRCVPADKNLKYHRLSDDAAKKRAEIEERLMRSDGIEKPLYRPEKDDFQNQDLLYKEHCYETGTPK